MQERALDSQKSIAISYLRVVAIISIVACHFLQYEDNNWAWILNVGVQIFFFISGFLYGFKQIGNWPHWFLRRIKRVYIPYIVVVFVLLPIYFVIGGDIKSNIRSTICYVTDTQWFGGGIKGIGHLWFITAIFICYFITPVLHALRRKSSLMLGLVICYEMLDLLVLHYNISFFEPLFIFSFGYFWVNSNRVSKKLSMAFVSIVAIGIICCIDWQHILMYDGIQNRMLHIFCGLSFSLLFIETLSRIKSLRLFRVSSLIDKYSYQIYLLHHPIILGPLSLMALTPFVGLNIIIILSLTTVSAYFLNTIYNRINRYIK